MENIKFALSSIWGHKMRSLLTMLGIIIGVASVVIITALGEGMKDGQAKSLSKSQQNSQIFFSPRRSNYLQEFGSARNSDDSEESEEDLASITQPVIQESWIKEVAKINGIDGYYVTNNAVATFSSQNKEAKNISITGVNSTFFKVKKYNILAGRSLTSNDYRGFSRVVMLDDVLAQRLYGSEKESLNKLVSIDGNSYRVIGVYTDPDAQASLTVVKNGGGEAVMANTQVAAEFGTDEISQVVVHIPDPSRIREVGVAAAKELTKISGVTRGEFQVLNADSLLKEINQLLSVMTAVIGTIAGIALLVGGIGVMNIMLVSVTERTREIGLRKALGATRGNILLQFLVESMILTVIGGLIGLGLAYCVTTLIGMFASDFFGGAPIISLGAVVISVLFSAAIGIIFGLLPANKASKLDPIEALRYE